MALIETKGGCDQSGRDCVCPGGSKASGLSANNLLVTYVAFSEGSWLVCFVSWWQSKLRNEFNKFFSAASISSCGSSERPKKAFKNWYLI